MGSSSLALVEKSLINYASHGMVEARAEALIGRPRPAPGEEWEDGWLRESHM